MNQVRVAVGAASVFGALLLISGCAATNQTEDVIAGDPSSTLSYAEIQGWDDVVAMLSDGVVTAEENAASHEAWKKCREELGFSFGPSTLDPINGKLFLEKEEYRGGDSVDQRAHELCYARYSDTVELVYQSKSPSQMNPALLSQTQSCLDEAGYERPNVGGETRLKDFYAEGAGYKSGDAVYQCVEKAYFELFPDLPGLAYGFTLAD